MAVRAGKSSPALSGGAPKPLTQRQYDERCAELRRLGATASEIADFRGRVQIKVPPPLGPPKPRHGFAKGVSGNPGGRPKELTAVRDLARQHTMTALNSLVEISQKGKSETARVLASNSLLDRGWGKPVQPLATDRDWLFPSGEVIEGRVVDEDARQQAIAALEAAFAEARELAPRLTSPLPSDVGEQERRAESILSAAGEPDAASLPERAPEQDAAADGPETEFGDVSDKVVAMTPGLPRRLTAEEMRKRGYHPNGKKIVKGF
jgi:Family of unknown function (DUF5681)